MNPEAVEKLLDKELGSGGTIYPDYGRYCINAVPALLADLFDGRRTTPLTKAIVPGGDEPVATVITFLIDGLGYRKARKVLRNMPTEEGSILNQNIYPVTSVFPSETTAALTSLLTGVPPNRHGLPGWLLHLKEYGKTVQCPEFVSISPRNETINFDVDDVLLSECTPVFEKLSERGVSSYSYLRDEIATGAYSYRLYSGSQIVSYSGLKGLFGTLREHVGGESPNYHYCYIDQLDISMHEAGPTDREVTNLIREIFDGINEFLRENADSIPRPAKVLLLSDHGQVPTSTISIEQYLEFLPCELARRSGDYQPTGTPRSNFLRVQMDVERAGRMIHDRTDALVFTREEWSEAGLFGPDVAASGFDERVGDLTMLPDVNDAVWNPEWPGFEFNGNHGGLTKGEMLVPLFVYDLP